MTDPFYMLILLKNLGKDYIVWDKSASIKFIKPGKSTAKAVFMVNEPILQEIREQVEQNGKTTKVFSVPIHDANGELIALVEKNLYIRKKESKNKIDSSVDTLNNNYNNKTN
jgi:acyl-CoA thioesterase